MIVAIGALIYDNAVVRHSATTGHDTMVHPSPVRTISTASPGMEAVSEISSDSGNAASTLTERNDLDLARDPGWLTEGVDNVRVKRDIFSPAESRFPESKVQDLSVPIKEKPIKVAGVIQEGSESYVFVDNTIYKTGDFIGRWRVKEIRTSYIVLENNTIEKIIPIEPFSVKNFHK